MSPPSTDPFHGEDSPAEPPRIAPPESVPPVSAESLVDGERPRAGDAEPRRYPSTIGGAFYLLVLAAVAVGLALVVLAEWRTGIRVIGGALVFAALVRLLLRARDAGMLAVRHKVLDAFVLVALGAALIFLAGSIPDQPGF
ncbi:MAG: hypothetical protein AVDCRST_MAG32-1227 [uncultured Nocardioides sp.]|uniref:Integral membrane protein n=1 Tax=uncultured Nocardioides sp. TaxID=198441 RepID=A0A6J4N4I1_9ACTN|nr:MAG: hypothetical protein AVDCRST_MAG32-1227 [uncultured Nocardioides sp.]